jgi:hypothetical protein
LKRKRDRAVNSSEQFVYEVCQKSFLSLWSYVNPQGRTPGKELCDILAVCDPHVIVVSVRNVELKDSGNVKVDWDRWQRKAIDASKKKIAGAIRWLDMAQVVVAKDGTEGLPLPTLEQRVYHRIAVAFGGRREVPITSSGAKDEPFVHVLDERAFYLLLRHLDTISDFVQYLADKEDFLTRAKIIMEGGEENLLAIYLHNGRKFPQGPDMVILQDDLWQGFSAKPEFLAKLDKDRDSYVWDRLIESFCVGGFDAETWRGPGLAESEQALRVLARENRFCRRLLGGAFRRFLEESKARRIRSRCVVSPSGVGYVFLTYDADSSLKARRHELLGRCFASLCLFPDVSTVIGIDSNVPGESPRDGYTSDLVMLHTDVGVWPEECLEKAQSFRDELGYFKTPNETRIHEDEYPVVNQDTRSQQEDGEGR